jgi:ketosteroid isomerase-like protein
MNQQQAIIEKFYQAFQQLDHVTMKGCYHEHVVFSDPVFGLLEGEEVFAMWEMLCKKAKDFTLDFGDIEIVDDEYATCKWNAHYIFSGTGRKVDNKIKAFMRIQDGKIIEHSDAFSFYKWCQMAFGIKGIVFGWTNFMQARIRRQARMNLEKFMNAGS